MSDSGIWVAATAAEIRAIEDEVLARVGEDPLMDRAADAVAAEARALLRADGRGVEGTRIILLVGTGNNGGDALLAGARLAADGASVTAILTGEQAHPRGLESLKAAGGTTLVTIGDPGQVAAIESADLVIDGIVGIGASPGLREPALTLVRAIPALTPVLAVDLPSGLDPDSGAVGLPHVRATVTVTFTCPKPCLLLPPAALDAGVVKVADVGIPVPEGAPDAPKRLTTSGAGRLWPVPGPRDHKYSRGIVGVVAGSDRYPGAAILACSAAVRSGAGMVSYIGPRRVQDLVLAARPEVVASEPPTAPGDLPRADAWVIGPGVGDEAAQLGAMEAAIASGASLVIDAGAVEWFAARRPRSGPIDPDRILLTPHAGELARALAAIGGVTGAPDPVTEARTLATALGATVLLKGAVTLVASPDGTLWSQADAPAWLATAGAGDVLAGIAGTLLAAGLPADVAGAIAALVHGRAATLASGGGPLAALDVADALPATVDALPSAVRDLLADPGAPSAT